MVTFAFAKRSARRTRLVPLYAWRGRSLDFWERSFGVAALTGESKVKPRFDVLFIDFYGTLVTGDRRAVEETCAQVVADHRLALTPAELAVVWGERFFQAIDSRNHHAFVTLYDCECVTLRETVHDLIGARIDPRPYADRLKAYWMDPPVVPGTANALADIGIPICVVSNADTADVRAALARNRLPVDEVVTSEDARSYKPDSVIFEHALAAMRVSPERVLHVGDSLYSDVQGATRMGIASCWIQYEDRILDIGEAKPDHNIHHLNELHAIL